MHAVRFTAPGHVETGWCEEPRARRGEALVRVAAAGVCAADLYTYEGRNPYVSYPRIGGHELSGTVEALGPETEGPAVGARVVIEPFINCGACYPCRIGKGNCCTNLEILGIHREGGFADVVAVPVDRLHGIPDHLDFVRASFAEPVAIAVQAARRGAIAASETVLVLGAGPIGLAVLEIARERGARAFVSDLSETRLAYAADLGGMPIAAGPALRERVEEATAGEGMPVVVEATGNPRVMEATIDLVAPGGRIVILGVVKPGTEVTFPALDLTRKEVTLVGSRASVGCFPESVALLAAGKLRYPDVATMFRLDDAPTLFKAMARDPTKTHKAVFVPAQ